MDITAARLAQLPDRKLVNLITTPNALAAKWRNPSTGALCAAVWIGRAIKPTWRYRFDTEAQRNAKLTATLTGLKAATRSKPAARALVVGDILRASWGYDQTNIDYYQVTATPGAATVEVRPIAPQTHATGDMTGRSVPEVGNFTGPAKRYRANGDSIRIASYCSAYRMAPTVVAGVTLYPSTSFSSYA